MNTNQYTQKTLEALQAAQQLAVEYQHNALEPAHLLHALAAQENGLIPQLLQKLNVDPGSFAAAVAEKLSALPRVSGSGRDPDKVYISQATDKVLSAAAREAIRHKEGNLTGRMESQGTTPRRLTDLLGSLCDLVSGSGDKGTPVVFIQGYFDNFADE